MISQEKDQSAKKDSPRVGKNRNFENSHSRKKES